MTGWNESELNAINAADEVEVSALKSDGSLRKPVTIWHVRIGEHLYVRSVNGRTSAWFRAVSTLYVGSITAARITKQVTFVEVNDAGLQDQIDAAYRKKYAHYPVAYIDHVNGAEAHTATLQIVPK